MLEHVPASVGQALSSVRSGLEKIAYYRADLKAPETLAVSSSAFASEGEMPARFTADGAKLSPPLSFGGTPANIASLALVVEDADSPTPSPFCHALVWNIPAECDGFQESALDSEAMPTTRRGAFVGKNSFLAKGWLPPDPPTGHGAHRYCFQLFALDVEPALEEGAGRSTVLDALSGHVIAKGLLIGTYERKA